MTTVSRTPRAPRTPEFISWLAWFALAGLLALIIPFVIGALNSVDFLAEFLPVLAPNKVQLAIVAMVFGVCVVVILVATGVLVLYTQTDRIFRPAASRWVDVLVAAFIGATATVVAALFFIPGPPQLYILVEACVLIGLATTFVLIVMRALLRRAVAMYRELDEVI